MHHILALAILSLAALPVAAQESADLDRMFPVGRDFCFTRTYDADHMARHPRQSVRAITVMGRNAHRTALAPGATPDEKTVSGLNVRASLRITFRDGTVRDWPGTCHEDDRRPGHPVTCRFVPHRNADTVEFSLSLRRQGGRIEAATDTDIGHFRRAPDDGAPPETVRSDDRAFALQAAAPATCPYPKAYWTGAGATRRLEESLP